MTAGPLRVLIADDHPLFRAGMRALLEAVADMQVVGMAATGDEVLALAERCQPDVVLMDLQMPEMGGLEATAAVREKEKASGGHIPIIAVTAHALKGDRERCLENGMDGYISKPVQPGLLLAELAQVTLNRAPEKGTSPAQELAPASPVPLRP